MGGVAEHENTRDSKVLYQCNDMILQHHPKPSYYKQLNWLLIIFDHTDLNLTTVLVLIKC
jgi:hypothetical protein